MGCFRLRAEVTDEERLGLRKKQEKGAAMRKFMILVFIVAATGIGGSGSAWSKHKTAHPKRLLSVPTVNGVSRRGGHEDEIGVQGINRKTPANNGSGVSNPAHRTSPISRPMKR
jgi:hypothetical protein